MGNKLIGIEIGSDTVKLAVCVNGKVTQMASKRLRRASVIDGKIASVNDMASTIKDLMKEAGIRGSDCAIVLPSQLIIGRRISMPAMSDTEYMLNLPYEFKDFVGKDSDKYYYDYVVKSVVGNSAELYACAVLKSDIDTYYDVTRKAGLKLKVAIPPEIAWLNLIRRAKNEPKNICIVDVGNNTTSVNIYSNGGFVMGKEIDCAGLAIDEVLGRYLGMDTYAARTRKESNLNNCIAADCCTDVYSEIAFEVTRILKYYNDVHSDSAVHDIYYCGGSAVIEPLRTAIIKATDMTPHHISRLVPNAGEKDDLTLVCAIAAGSAV